jgi:Domain of unknown function (DUF5666)
MDISEQTPEPTPPPAPSWRSWAIAGAVVAIIAAAAAFFLGGSGDDTGTDTIAATGGTVPAGGGFPGGGAGLGARGTITSIDGSTITVDSQAPDGSSSTTTVETTDDTTVTEAVEGSADDLEVGDTVTAFGQADDEGAIEAVSITEGGGFAFGNGGPPTDGTLPEGFDPPTDGTLPEGFDPPQGGGLPGGGQGGAPTSGEITAIDGDTLTVDADGTSVTIVITDETTITLNEERSLDDLAEGDTILAVGETDGDVVTADSIRIGDLGFGGAGFPGGGQFPGGGGQPPAAPGAPSIPTTEGA